MNKYIGIALMGILTLAAPGLLAQTRTQTIIWEGPLTGQIELKSGEIFPLPSDLVQTFADTDTNHTQGVVIFKVSPPLKGPALLNLGETSFGLGTFEAAKDYFVVATKADSKSILSPIKVPTLKKSEAVLLVGDIWDSALGWFLSMNALDLGVYWGIDMQHPRYAPTMKPNVKPTMRLGEDWSSKPALEVSMIFPADVVPYAALYKFPAGNHAIMTGLPGLEKEFGAPRFDVDKFGSPAQSTFEAGKVYIVMEGARFGSELKLLFPKEVPQATLSKQK
ncbi:MAG: hypothetical protein WCG80_17820 [Spirochaetales bacterium]